MYWLSTKVEFSDFLLRYMWGGGGVFFERMYVCIYLFGTLRNHPGR